MSNVPIQASRNVQNFAPNRKESIVTVISVLYVLAAVFAFLASPSYAADPDNNKSCAEILNARIEPCPEEVEKQQCEARNRLLEGTNAEICSDIMDGAKPSKTKSWPQLDWLNEGILAILGAIAAAVLSVWSSLLKRALTRTKELLAQMIERMGDPFFQRPEIYTSGSVNLLLVGEGGSGKTTLIHALTGSDKARPDISTNEVSTYTLVHEVNVTTKSKELERRLLRVYADDYVGQLTDQLLENESLKERQKIAPTVLTIVIDATVADQQDVYVAPYRQILNKLAGDNSKQVVIFLNKTDRLSKAKRSELLDNIEKGLRTDFTVRGRRVDVIEGSAITGKGVVGYDNGVEHNRSLYKIVYDAAFKGAWI